MEQQLRVIVTGGTSGIGLACVEAFCARGDRVLTTGRRVDRLQRLQDRHPEQVETLAFDVGDRQAVVAALGDLPQPWDEIDVLVNNAGLAKGLEPAHEADLDDWDEMIDTNCRGLVTCTRALLPGMVRRGRGHVVNLGSIAGSYPYPGGNVYGATKAFVAQFSRNLRSDLHGTGVRVTDIEPGLSGGTEFSHVRFEGDTSKVEALYDGAEPLRPEDVADAVAWAVSQPRHVNVNAIELMPVSQSAAALQVHRDPPLDRGGRS